jgi:hypothetical protein
MVRPNDLYEVFGNGTIDSAMAKIPIDERAANARLIAAAPELLEALRYFVERDYTYFIGEAINQHTLGVTREQVLKARAAIQKATGHE